MSVSGGAVLLLSICEDRHEEFVEKINATLVESGCRSGVLSRVDKDIKSKHIFPGVAYVGGYNYLVPALLCEAVLAHPWERPEEIMLIINDESYTDDEYVVYIRDGKVSRNG